MGQAFDDSKNDNTFYLPPEVFDNPEFQRGLKLFLSPDGHAARMIITHDGDPATTEGISHIDPIRSAARKRSRAPRWRDATIYIGGTAATYKDIRDGAEIRPDDRGDLGAQPDPADHDVRHPQPGGRPGHRGHGGAVAGRLVRAVGAGLAVHPGHPAVLDRARAGGHPAVGGGLGLQPAADLPVQGGDPCRAEHRHHPAMAGTGSVVTSAGSGVRVHHGRLRRSATCACSARSAPPSASGCCSTP